MWLDSASQEAVERFWQQCGEVEPYPRSLERSLSLALPVVLVKLPHLKLQGVESWFAQRSATFQFNCRSRAVRGCLLAYGGHGLIFVDGADPEDERRFTVAHEVAHFIVDYWLVRERACAKFGGQIIEVFDGVRRPSVSERVGALLAGAQLGVYTKLIERDEAGAATQGAVYQIEDRADRVALALLAPPEDVLAEADTSAVNFTLRHESVSELLCTRFGLPASAGATYARSLLESVGRGPSWVETLRLR
ncbi:MAG: hypothetical protein DMF64_02975 [Acidobacteria bacterium]|nr:MAG: hypothetical protein DMF64_02975 [Acidobacteriota bacterium]